MLSERPPCRSSAISNESDVFLHSNCSIQWENVLHMFLTLHCVLHEKGESSAQGHALSSSIPIFIIHFIIHLHLKSTHLSFLFCNRKILCICRLSHMSYVSSHLILRLCGLVVRVPGYRSRGPGSIPSAIRFSEK
jgi:hypothetical protein